MTVIFHPRFLPAILASAIALQAWSAEPLAWDKRAFREEVLLVPPAPQGFGAPGPKYLEKQIGRELTPDEMRIYRHSDGGKWRRFEDDLIGFDLPDTEGLNIDVITPGKSAALRIVGGAVGTTDNRFERAYRITVGHQKLPYGILLVSRNDWLDEGICFCGPVAFKRLLIRDQTLLEFSLLPGGSSKKIQALSGNGLRAVLFEWTHSAIEQDTYARIGQSIRFPGSEGLSRTEWVAKLKEHRKPEERFGLISVGDSTEEIHNLLGKALPIEHGRAVFEVERGTEDGTRWVTRIVFPLRQGKFRGYEKTWFDSREVAPLPGSIRWAEEWIESRNSVSPKDGTRIVEAFLEKAPGADASWDRWCRVLKDLLEKGHRDDRVLAVIRKRFLDPDLHNHHAAWVLHEYEADGRDKLFAGRLRLTFEQEQGGDSLGPLDDAWNLFSFLDRDHPAYLDLLRQALAHSNPGFQADGLYRAHHLPAEEARRVAREKSKSPDRHVRSMTEGLYRKIGSSEDLEVLRSWRDREADKRLRRELGELIESLAEKAGSED